MPTTVVFTRVARCQPTKTAVAAYQKGWAPLFLKFMGQYALSQYFLVLLNKDCVDSVPQFTARPTS
jgi:hypothetical protein